MAKYGEHRGFHEGMAKVSRIVALARGESARCDGVLPASVWVREGRCEFKRGHAGGHGVIAQVVRSRKKQSTDP